MDPKPILLFADRLPPLIGGMEMHARYFIEYFSQRLSYPLLGIITKTANGEDYLLANDRQQIINIAELSKLFKPAVIFFNSGRWIEKLSCLRALFPSAIFLYRTGGNEILKAPLIYQNIKSHKLRQAYWVSNINHSIDLLITNSGFTEDRLSNLGIKCPFSRCIGGVNIEALKGKAFPSSNKTLRIFCAARFVPYKNHELLISVIHELMSRGHNISLHLAGDGPLLDKIKKRVMQNKLESLVEFLGILDNEGVCKEIVKADVYMQLSNDYLTKVPGGKYIHSEGMGRSVLEALSAGTFVIAGKCGALPEVVSKDRGLLIELTNLMDITNKIEEALAKLPLKLSFNNSYSWKNLFAQYEKIIARLTAQ